MLHSNLSSVIIVYGGDEMKDYCNRKELAEYFNVNPCTIHRWRSQGCPFIKLVTGRIVYSKQDVEKWLLGEK